MSAFSNPIQSNPIQGFCGFHNLFRFVVILSESRLAGRVEGSLFFFFSFFLLSFTFFLFPSPVFAYSTGMSASVVVGQTNFTSTSANQGGSAAANTLNRPTAVYISNGKMFVSDRINSRILIYNRLPTTNNASADIVIGQASFSGSSANQGGSRGANTLANPWAVFNDGQRMYVSDFSNHRVLIWNTVPVSNNTSADVVIGQSNFTSGSADGGGSKSASGLQGPRGIWSDGYKLILADTANNRVLIFNTIPTTNGASADVVVGQQNFTTASQNQGGSAAANTMYQPTGVWVDNGKLFVTDTWNNRILIFNSIPTANNASADVIVANTGGTISSGFETLGGIFTYSSRLFVSDIANHRVLIYNSIPTSNSATADIVIGQQNFTSGSQNQGGSAAANTLTAPYFIATDGEHLYVPNDLNVGSSNNRILIFTNTITKPDLTLSSSPSTTNGKLTMSGTATVESPYRLTNVQYAVNGGSFSGATPTDGNFDSSSEAYSFSFAPTDNQPVDSSGSPIPGYTIRVKSTNNNADTIDNLFFMSPFTLHSPDNYAQIQTSGGSSSTTSSASSSVLSSLAFEFSVNKQRVILKDSLSKYQILVKKLGSSTWETYLDDIPVDFRTMKDSSNNKKRSIYGHLDTDNGVYETDTMVASYREESSKIKVYSKTKTLSSGAYTWKAIAVNNGATQQETEERIFYLNTTPSSSSQASSFPLAILNISGVGDPHINSYNLSSMQDSYTTSSPNPIFYGIAYVGSTVTLSLTDRDCFSRQGGGIAMTGECTKTYTTTTNPESRWGINIPMGALLPGTSYTLKASVRLGERYMEVPEFTIKLKSF